MKTKPLALTLVVMALFVFLLSLCTLADEMDLRQHINDYIKEFYEIDEDFYPETATINGKTMHLNLSPRMEEYEKYGVLLNPLTYGSNGTMQVSGWGAVAFIGYNIFGDQIRAPFDLTHNTFENPVRILPDFYKWSSWDGNSLARGPKKYTDSKMAGWVELTSRWSTQTKDTFNDTRYSVSEIIKTENGSAKRDMLEEAVQAGLDIVYANEALHANMIRKGYSDKYYLHKEGDKPLFDKNNKWTDYLLIVIPPTDISWGLAWRFNISSSGNYHIIDIPVAPFNMAVSLDLSVNFRDATVTANPGDTVSFTAEVRSNLDQKTENIAYKWTITDANGNPISGVSYGGHGTSSNGVFNTEENKAITKQFIAQFTMPETAVNVTFEVNGDKKHAETNTENNKVSEIVQVLMPTPPVIAGEVILDFDIYSRDHNDNLAAMTARFSHDCDSITAYINAESQNTSILSYYSYQTRDSDSGRSITVTPWYKSILYRTGFGDNPEGRTYLPNGIYPLMVAQVGSGKAIGNYVEPGPPGEDGSPTWISGSQTSYFPTTTTNLPVTAYVYNGVPLGQPYTKNEVSSTNILWTSEIIDFNVVRKMYHMDANGNRVNEKDIPGQYVRHFSAQNSASVVWSAPLTQAQAYANDRRTAANRGATYQNAIFATDKEFAKVDYPVKSGYMFNPLGTYKCVVNSTVYYDSSASEAEKKQAHEELVNKVINSFVYDNAMTYTNNGKDEVSFMGVTNSNKKGILNISRTDNVSINLIPVEQYNTCMEGYEESGTLNSFTDYKYREYIVTDRVSRIDAQTVLTFTVGSPSKRYTHINLPDGQYPITARSLPFAYKGLTAPGVYLSDGITVSVRGSLYDDRG